jgi:hypothetical protein
MTERNTRLVDPVHFFNSEGTPVLTLKYLLDRNEALEDEVQRLTRLLRAQIERNGGDHRVTEKIEKH